MTIDIIMVHPFFSFFFGSRFFFKILGSFCSHLQKGKFLKKENKILIFFFEIHFKFFCKCGKLFFSYFFSVLKFGQILPLPISYFCHLVAKQLYAIFCNLLFLPTHPPTPPKKGLNFPIACKILVLGLFPKQNK